MSLTLSSIELILAAVAVIALILGLAALLRPRGRDAGLDLRLGALEAAQERMERALREELSLNRQESGNGIKGLTETLSARLDGVARGLDGRFGQLATDSAGRLDEMRRTVDARLHSTMEQMALSRQEASTGLKGFGDTLSARLDALAQGLDSRFAQLAADSAAKLEEMRRTVDERLQGTLEQRLGESFKLVSDRLEQVHRGLGEMQNLATGVGDLKRVLTNVKSRGVWGEMQLDSLLSQILTPEQYLANVATVEGRSERVEFVIRLPGRNDNEEVWLPIDAKFPREDYERLVEAADRADPEAVELAARALETRLKGFARDMRDKYLNPPRTTDFAVMFLPTEGLYAEALRRPGLIDLLQREYRVIPAGPTTLAALLNSLQMGFRTLAIEKRSSEVWLLLGAVKTEFAKYGEVLDKVQKKLLEASHQIDNVAVRKRAIDRRLNKVQGLEGPAAATLIDAAASGDADEEV